MSNAHLDQTILFTPVLLTTPANIDQQPAAETFLQKEFKWDLKSKSLQMTWINQKQEIISIETIRNLIGELAYASHLGKPRVFILLYADKLSVAAQHAVLKSLEEPPPKTILVLVTTYPNRLLPTIKSRCLTHHHHLETKDLSDAKLPSTLEQVLLDSTACSLSQLIDLAAEYKDRDQAIQLVQLILFKLNHQRVNIYQPRLIKLQTQCLQTLHQLNANANIRLCLESCFFAMKN